MRSESNTIPTEKAAAGSQFRVFGALGLGAADARIAVALNRAEDGLPEGAQIGVCYALLGETRATELELIPAGKFTGRDGRTWTNDQPDQVIALSQAIQLPAGICIDEDHALEFAANDKVGGSAPAYGWIKSLEIREGAIWGKVEWTPLGIQAVDDKIYCGLSPVFAYDEKTGRVLALLSAGLTNKPNLSLTAFNSRQRPDVTSQEKNDMEKIAELLGLAKDAKPEAILTALNAFFGAFTKLLGVDVPAAIALNAESLEATLQKRFSGDVMTALCTSAGVAKGSTMDVILAALKAQTVDPSQYVPMAAHMSVKDALDKLQGAKPAELVDAALKDGRLYPTQKDWALAYAQRDLEGFVKYLGVTPEKLGEVKKPSEGGLDLADAKVVANAARTYVSEQQKLGITVSTAQAVNHVTTKGA